MRQAAAVEAAGMLGGIVMAGTRTLAKAMANATVDRTKSAVTGTGKIVRQTGSAAIDLSTDFVDVGAGAIGDIGKGMSRTVRGASDTVADATLSLLEALGLATKRKRESGLEAEPADETEGDV
jgi:hypothetical protein